MSARVPGRAVGPWPRWLLPALAAYVAGAAVLAAASLLPGLPPRLSAGLWYLSWDGVAPGRALTPLSWNEESTGAIRVCIVLVGGVANALFVLAAAFRASRGSRSARTAPTPRATGDTDASDATADTDDSDATADTDATADPPLVDFRFEVVAAYPVTRRGAAVTGRLVSGSIRNGQPATLYGGGTAVHVPIVLVELRPGTRQEHPALLLPDLDPGQIRPGGHLGPPQPRVDPGEDPTD